MKTVHRTLLGSLLLCAVLWLHPSARAEEAKPAVKERIRERLQEVAKELNLTDEQKEKLKPIVQAEWEKVRELRADTSLSREQKIEKLKALKEELAPKVKEILTPEQLAKWKEIREEFRANIAERRNQK